MLPYLGDPFKVATKCKEKFGTVSIANQAKYSETTSEYFNFLVIHVRKRSSVVLNKNQ